jgi:hypothetical protein
MHKNVKNTGSGEHGMMGSRHLICRYRAKDARSSVLPWLDNTIGKGGYNYLAHESMITLFNGSELWIESWGR